MITNNKRLKVLFITEFLPWPLTSGGIIRSYHILRQAALRHDVTLLTTCNEGYEEHFTGFVKQLHCIKLPLKSKVEKIFGALSSLNSPKPYLLVDCHFRKQMADRLVDLLRNDSFDLIHMDHLDAAVYAPYCGTTPIYLDEHNFETKLLRSVMTSTKNRLLKYYLKQQSVKLAAFEAQALEQADAVGAVSHHDADLIAQIVPREKIEVIPNGVDLDFFDIDRAPEPGQVVSVGSLDWPSNVEGMMWFLDSVWPLISKRCPEAAFTIVGRNPPNSLLKRAGGKVTIAGSVPDVRGYVKKASAFVVPLFSGGGTRLKVVEAMAMRVPLISTSIGIEGIECEDGRNVMVAEHPEKFADKVLQVLNDYQLATRLANNARRLVEERYGWNAIGDKLDDRYKSIVAEPVLAS